MDTQTATGTNETRTGLLYGLAAFLAWGFIAIYFRAVGDVAPEEVLAHRILWSAVFLVGLLAWQGRLGDVARALADRRTRRALFASTALILTNWYLFIWAVEHGRLLEASFGYFVNPLVNVLLGALFLHERLTAWQLGAVGLALLGVLHQAFALGAFPVLGMILPVSFGLYGLVRKTVRVDAPAGLAAETLLVTPLALAYLGWAGLTGNLALVSEGAGTAALLLAAGPITALPLLWFVHAARRLRYATVGFLQYLSPTLQFLTAVILFDEPFTTAHLVTFALIWLGLALYSADTLRETRRGRALARAAAAVAVAGE